MRIDVYSYPVRRSDGTARVHSFDCREHYYRHDGTILAPDGCELVRSRIGIAPLLQVPLPAGHGATLRLLASEAVEWAKASKHGLAWEPASNLSRS